MYVVDMCFLFPRHNYKLQPNQLCISPHFLGQRISTGIPTCTYCMQSSLLVLPSYAHLCHDDASRNRYYYPHSPMGTKPACICMYQWTLVPRTKQFPSYPKPICLHGSKGGGRRPEAHLRDVAQKCRVVSICRGRIFSVPVVLVLVGLSTSNRCIVKFCCVCVCTRK